MENFDTSPSTVTVTEVRILGNTAYFRAIDNSGVKWVITLNVGNFVGAKRWFAESVQDRVRENGRYVLISRYDSQADEWYTQGGNYGIYSKDLQFTEEA